MRYLEVGDKQAVRTLKVAPTDVSLHLQLSKFP